jgi:hypothetical protein
MSDWRRAPHYPRRLSTGITFDIVLAPSSLVGLAYNVLNRYEQTVGPAVRFTNLNTAAVLVPLGTAARWRHLVTSASGLDGQAVPTCLGTGHAVRIPGIVPSGHDVPVEWLKPPSVDAVVGGAPLLTAPVQLVRCLAEARSLLALNDQRIPLNEAASAIQAVLHPSQRT